MAAKMGKMGSILSFRASSSWAVYVQENRVDLVFAPNRLIVG